MNMNRTPGGREEAETIAESRLDEMLDMVEVPAPSPALRYRLYTLDAGRGPARRETLLARLGDWLVFGRGMRPAAGMAAMACTLVLGVVIGAMLPEEHGLPRTVAAAPPAPLVVAGLAAVPVEPDPLSVDRISLVAPRILSSGTADSGGTADDDGAGELPLY